MVKGRPAGTRSVVVDAELTVSQRRAARRAAMRALLERYRQEYETWYRLELERMAENA